MPILARLLTDIKIILEDSKKTCMEDSDTTSGGQQDLVENIEILLEDIKFLSQIVRHFLNDSKMPIQGNLWRYGDDHE